MRYRPEIDGLRAVAVIPVILFHAGFHIFKGGFVGVDIFFVISGYLITSIILAELKAGHFSIVGFYERRARRILPALFVVMAACLPAAWLWLLPQDMKNFSQSLVAVTGFFSNAFFWRTSGYFDADAALKPLLHTWSLAVEEQYYLFFPVLLLLMWRLGQRTIVAFLSVALGASLGLAQWGTHWTPDAAFYLLPMRGWELLVGSFVAFHLSGDARPAPREPVNQAVSAIGFALLLAALCLFDETTPFPGFHALVPTVGAALVIVAATPSTLVGRLLGHRLLVGIGLISYSAYLWHQPLLAFARHQSVDPPGRLACAALVLASLALAGVTWKYVETPFRNRKRVSRSAVFSYAAAGSILFAAVGHAGQLDGGHLGRFGAERREFLSHFDNSYPEWKYFKRENWYAAFRIECDFFDIPSELAGRPTQQRKDIAPACHTRDPGKKHAVLLWGDSHAQHLYIGLKRNLPDDWQILQVASSACRPSLRFDKNSGNYCLYSNYFAYETIRETRPDVVLIAQESGHDPAFMKEVTERLTRAGVRKLIFTGPSPHWLKGGLPSVVAFKLLDDRPRYSAVGLDPRVRDRDALLKKDFQQDAHARYVSLFDYFCRDGACLVYYGNDIRAGITTYDHAHLAAIASDHLSRDVLVPAVLGER